MREWMRVTIAVAVCSKITWHNAWFDTIQCLVRLKTVIESFAAVPVSRNAVCLIRLGPGVLTSIPKYLSFTSNVESVTTAETGVSNN